KGQVTPSCHIVPKGMPGYNPNLQCPGGAPTKGDPTKAKQLFTAGMAQEGLTLATFPSITFTYPSGSAARADIATTMIQEWQSVLGVSVKSQAVDFSTLIANTTATTCQTPTNPSACLNKGLQMWSLGWIADYPDPQDWTTLQFDNGAANNNSNYGQNFSSDAATQVQTQKQLEAADINLGSNRMAQYNRAEQQLVNDVAWMTLYQSTSVNLVRKDVQGVVLNAQGVTPPDDWANIYISVH
ncbi:MAG TPA: ABC transporter substrate-binding protein, partial [Ktedonobacteraceae bacterium]|nr:ABC transporter substrate-binding protein [Ktedonobacteraceae bacterium]